MRATGVWITDYQSGIMYDCIRLYEFIIGLLIENQAENWFGVRRLSSLATCVLEGMGFELHV